MCLSFATATTLKIHDCWSISEPLEIGFGRSRKLGILIGDQIRSLYSITWIKYCIFFLSFKISSLFVFNNKCRHIILTTELFNVFAFCRNRIHKCQKPSGPGSENLISIEKFKWWNKGLTCLVCWNALTLLLLNGGYLSIFILWEY